MQVFCSAGVRDADQGTEPGAGTPAGAGGGNRRAQGRTQQYSGKWKATSYPSLRREKAFQLVNKFPTKVT